jgi:hypothetical protein
MSAYRRRAQTLHGQGLSSWVLRRNCNYGQCFGVVVRAAARTPPPGLSSDKGPGRKLPAPKRIKRRCVGKNGLIGKQFRLRTISPAQHADVNVFFGEMQPSKTRRASGRNERSCGAGPTL